MALQQAAGFFCPNDVTFALKQLDGKWPKHGAECATTWTSIIRPTLQAVCYGVAHVYYIVSILCLCLNTRLTRDELQPVMLL